MVLILRFPYNLTSLTDQTGVFGFMNAANDVSGGLFGTLTLVTFFIIMVVAWRNEEPRKSFAASSFLTALISVFLRILGWIPDSTMFTTFIIAAVSFVMLVWSK